MEVKRLAHKLSAVGTVLAAGSTATALLTQLPPGTPESWMQPLHAVAIGTVILGGLLSAVGKVLMAWDADEDQANLLAAARKVATVVLIVVCMGFLTGCETSVAVKKSSTDAASAVSGTKNKDVPFIANFIANTWATHETNESTRLFNAALAENSVAATVATTLPTAGTAPPAAPVVKVVPEAIRAALQAKHDNDAKLIAIGQQQIYQAVLNRFAGNLNAAEALLDGQQNYYSTVGANQSTLQSGLDATLATFQQFAPVIATALTPTPATATVKSTTTTTVPKSTTTTTTVTAPVTGAIVN